MSRSIVRRMSVAAAALAVPLALASCQGSAPHHPQRRVTRAATTPAPNPHTADPNPRHLAVGDCFTADRTLTLIGATMPLAPVHIVPCTQPHIAEVYGRFSYYQARVPYPAGDQLADFADGDCENLVAAYDLDSWTLSPTTDLARSLLPTRAQWAAGDQEIICYWVPRGGGPTTIRLRHDKTTLSADQYAYLDAAYRPESALAQSPQSQGEDDRDSYQFWAAGVADSLAAESKLLQGRPWPVRAQGPVNALVQRVDALATQWRDASQGITLASIKRATHTLQGEDSVPQERAVRQALGLATTRAR